MMRPPLLLLLLTGLACGLVGCGDSSHAGDRAAAPEAMTIAVIPKATTHSYWKAAEAGARRAAAELGVNLEWQGPLDDSRIADQIAIFNNLAASGVKAILLAPCDDKALAPHVRNAVRRGIAVAIFDSPLEAEPGRDFVTFIATDNRAAGQTAGETLAEAIGPNPPHGGEVLMIRFTEGSASTRLREEGFVAALEAAPGLRLVAQQFTDGSMAGAQRVAEALLNNHVRNNTLELAGLFASNQPTAEGAFNALRALRAKGVQVPTRFVGFDDSTLLVQGLESGAIDALVVQAPDRMGYDGVKALVDHLAGRPVELRVDTGVTVRGRAAR